jgi:hypothetical protein
LEPFRFLTALGQTGPLIQTRSTEAFLVVLPLGILSCRYFSSDPRKRNVGLDAAQLAERSFGNVELTGRAGGRRQDPVCPNEIGALSDALAGEPHRLFVVAVYELRILQWRSRLKANVCEIFGVGQFSTLISAQMRSADRIEQCPLSGVTEKTFAHAEFFSV